MEAFRVRKIIYTNNIVEGDITEIPVPIPFFGFENIVHIIVDRGNITNGNQRLGLLSLCRFHKID